MSTKIKSVLSVLVAIVAVGTAIESAAAASPENLEKRVASHAAKSFPAPTTRTSPKSTESAMRATPASVRGSVARSGAGVTVQLSYWDANRRAWVGLNPTAKTNSSGGYSFTNLTPGHYYAVWASSVVDACVSARWMKVFGNWSPYFLARSGTTHVASVPTLQHIRTISC